MLAATLLAEANWLTWWLAPGPLLLFVLACAGHGYLHVVWLNYLYGLPFPRWFLHLLRRINFTLILAGPILFWLIFGLGLDSSTTAGLLLTGYLRLCLLAAVVGLATTLWLRLRPKPLALVSNHSQVIDIAAELGYRPIGRGKRAHLARLPFNQLFEVEFSEKTLVLPRLPSECAGVTILHISDLHFRGVPDRIFYEKVIERCRAWEPDIVALTGDFVDTEEHHQWIVPVLQELTWRLAGFAILGNHDSWYSVEPTCRELRRVGLHLLENTWEKLTVRGQEWVVVGHQGPWFLPEPDLREAPAGFRLCLSHTPDNIAWARQHHIDLMLAGHNHGGQIRLPLIGSVVVPSRYGRRYDCGTFDEPPTLLHVSRGLAGQHPLRINCRPEVTLLRLCGSSSRPPGPTHPRSPSGRRRGSNRWAPS